MGDLTLANGSKIAVSEVESIRGRAAFDEMRFVRIATIEEEMSGDIPPGSISLGTAFNAVGHLTRRCPHGVGLDHDCAECETPK